MRVSPAITNWMEDRLENVVPQNASIKEVLPTEEAPIMQILIRIMVFASLVVACSDEKQVSSLKRFSGSA